MVPSLKISSHEHSYINTQSTSPKALQHSKSEHTPEATVSPNLPLDLQAMIIDQVAADLGPQQSPSSRIYSAATRDTLRVLCTVNRFFEAIAIRHLYRLVHLKSPRQLDAFRKSIAYFGRPTALAKHVRTFSISSTTHIASYQFAQDMMTVLHVLHPWVERLLLDVRRRHHVRQTTSSGGQNIGVLQGGVTRITTAVTIFSTPWSKLIEVSISEGLDQYLHMPRLPRAFHNLQRLALGHTTVTANLLDQLVEMRSLEELIMVNSSIQRKDFQRSVPTAIATLFDLSPSLRRFVWIVTPRPQWDTDELTSVHAALFDAELLWNVPGVEVIYEPREQDVNDIFLEGLSGPCLLGEGAKSGSIWES